MAWPSSSARTKNWGTEILTDADQESQLDLLHTYLNDAFHASTGHDHSGGTAEGPKITLTGSAGVQGILPLANGGTGQATLAAFLNLIYPVGSVYTNASDSTNPGTLLGFGTWVTVGAGKVIVAIDSGDTDFDTAGETGGAKTVSHTHTGTTSTPSGAASAGGTGSSAANPTHTHTFTTDSSSPSVVQPYVICYVWKRTA